MQPPPPPLPQQQQQQQLTGLANTSKRARDAGTEGKVCSRQRTGEEMVLPRLFHWFSRQNSELHQHSGVAAQVATRALRSAQGGDSEGGLVVLMIEALVSEAARTGSPLTAGALAKACTPLLPRD